MVERERQQFSLWPLFWERLYFKYRFMTSLVSLCIHASQFPENVRRDLLESLQSRQVNHKFLYDSLRQTAKWLALHQAYSPSRNDPDCARTYDKAFHEALEQIPAPRVHVIGLGCGGGQKDARLLKLLRNSRKEVFYTPCDVSSAMVLQARRTALESEPDLACLPLVCDLSQTDDLPAVLEAQANSVCHMPDLPARGGPEVVRLLTFFGMLPNFESGVILPRLAEAIRPGDFLLLSANLAPGDDYAAGVGRVLPLYDNEMTRDWLLTFLLDLGVAREDGDIRFSVEEDPHNRTLKRIAAYFHFLRPRELKVDTHVFNFRSGETIRLFFSYRHTAALVGALLGEHGLGVLNQWITRSDEEGVFLVSRLRKPPVCPTRL